MGNYPASPFLPTSRKELELRGWDNVDIVLFTGDAYVDHPSFGPAIIARVLENAGYRVAVVPQPNWQDDGRDFAKMGKPRLFFGVSAGNMDSMVNHYTAARRRRSDDAYTPEGAAGRRPDRAVCVYTQWIKRLFPDVPVVIGGIEASLRRLCHYDYWDNSLHPSVLLDSGADYLVYGMGERPMLALASALRKRASEQEIRSIPQIVYSRPLQDSPHTEDLIRLPSFEECKAKKENFASHFRIVEQQANSSHPKILSEECGQREVIVNPPFPQMTSQQLDEVYDLPYTFQAHPRYKGKTIPALEMVRFSICLHRGCFGACSFCTIAAHQGRQITSRSPESVLREIGRLQQLPQYKGVLSDLGGPSANMYSMHGRNLALCDACRRSSCLFPKLCSNLEHSHRPLLDLYAKVRAVPGLKHAFVGSGIRYDLFLNEKGFLDEDGKEYFQTLLRHHVSGRLKVAPEHTRDVVLRCMGKPSFALFERLKLEFEKQNRSENLREQLIPYFISSHPACTLLDMKALAKVFSQEGIKVEQVQDFTPTPMTRSSVMFYSGIDPSTGERVFCERDPKAKQAQKALFFKFS